MVSLPYTISDEAYLTIVMHLAKYPSAVNGVLMGSESEDGLVAITRALPIAHSSLAVNTTPVTEMALLLAEQKASEHGLRLVGAYFGNELADDSSIGVAPTRLAERLRAHFAKACLLMVNASKLAPSARSTEHCLRLCVRETEQASTWAKAVRSAGDLRVSSAALGLADALLRGKGAVHDVSDFEDHCLDPRRDWFNEGIHRSWPSPQTIS